MLYGFLRPLILALFRAWFRLRTVGLEHVPSTGPLLFASNHASVLDPPAIGAPLGRRIHFMAKAELFRIPVFGGLIRRLNAHPVDRSGSDAAALRLARALLGAGHALLVFPEGTRATDEGLRPGRPGVGLLAAASEAPVVPVYVRGTGRALPRGALFPRPVRVTVCYGPPLRFGRTRGKDRYQAISDEVMAAIGRLKEELERGGPRETAPRSTDALRTVRRALLAGRIH